MTLDYSVDGKLKIRMEAYIEKLIRELTEYYNGFAATPAASNLFQIRDDAERLSKTLADEFHTVVAKLLFLSLRAHPDILTAVSMLCTRVSKPDMEDRAKLR